MSVNFFGSLLLTLHLAFEEFATMEVIEHYEKKLLRHIEDPDTVLYCLKKLDAVHVTIEILQDSEVGKVVNRLKKRTDSTPDVISSSKELVKKWKELVKNANEALKPQKVAVNERPKAVSSSSSKSKIPSEERNSSFSSSKNHHGHHKKDKQEKYKESVKKENQKDKSEKLSSHHKHHKSHKSSSSSQDKQAAEVSSNGSSHSASNNGNNIEIPTDINPNYKPPKVRQRYSDQQQTTVCF